MLALCRLWALIWFLLDWELLACGTPPCEQYDHSTSLRPRLSGEAQIFLPGSEGYGNATLRWSRLIDPNLAMVVAPKTERDIQETVRHPTPGPKLYPRPPPPAFSLATFN